MHINVEEIKKFEQKIKLKDMPYAVIIEPTNYCNFRCKMCMNSTMKRPKGYMDRQLYEKIIDELAEKNPNVSLWLNGLGEPLLCKDLPDWIRYAVDKGLTNVSVNTNASLLTKEMSDALVMSGLHAIVCGVDAFDKEVYEGIRIGGKRDVVYQNIEYLLQKVNETEGCNLKVEVQQIEMEYNQAEQERFICYWRERGAYIKLIAYQTWLGYGEKQWDSLSERYACSKCNMFQIFWDGRVPMCGCDYDIACEAGNIKHQSIYEVWQKIKREFSLLHIEHQFDDLPEWCQNCTDWMQYESKVYNPKGELLKK